MALSGPASLSRERAQSSFPVREMTYLIDGGKEETERKERIAELVAADPIFNKEDKVFLSRPEAFRRALGKLVRAIQIREAENLPEKDWARLLHFINEDVPFGVHFSMFIPHLESQGTDEQKEKWLGPARRCELIGCYAQTELGHGSNVQGLETTATYDKKTQEFILNSPTLTSLKWWPGGLGTCATHCVTHARLIIDGKDYGVHAFFAPIRCLETHNALPGITVGQIGPKFGYETVDNGFLGFDNVRIPRGNLLARYSTVAPDGTYTKSSVNPKVAYLTMVQIRVAIVRFSVTALSRAVTIVTRYSLVRRQFAKLGDSETQVFDYQMQRYRILPLLAASYAFIFSSRHVANLHAALLSGISGGDTELELLPELHATCAGMKACTTWVAKAGIEECREACGGHGYSQFSGIDEIFRTFAPACTYEGDNVVLCLQVARYLLKNMASAMAGKKLPTSVDYLEGVKSGTEEKCTATTVDDMFKTSVQLGLSRCRARALVRRTSSQVQKRLAGGKDEGTALNDVMVDSVHMVQAHVEYNVLHHFVLGVEATGNRACKDVLAKLCSLYALYNAEQNLSDLIEVGYVSAAQVALVRGAVRQLLDELRPQAIPLTDAFNNPDFLLNSSLGRANGDVYEHMYAWAKRDVFNNGSKVGYEEYLRPLLKGRLTGKNNQVQARL